MIPSDRTDKGGEELKGLPHVMSALELEEGGGL